jgi:hypothetical protein
MPRCDNCGKERPKTTEVTVWTARIVPKTNGVNAPSSHHNLNTYTEFVQHHFQVCQRCLDWDRYRSIVVGIALMVLAFAAMGVTATLGWSTRVAAGVGLGIMVVGYFVISRLGRAWRQNKRVLAYRHIQDPKYRHRVFSEAEYKESIRIKVATRN